MVSGWDPLAQPPADASTEERISWRFAHMAGFQLAHPEMPQGNWMRLKSREQKLIVAEYELAVATAEHGGAIPPKIERAIRTGTFASLAPRKRR